MRLPCCFVDQKGFTASKRTILATTSQTLLKRNPGKEKDLKKDGMTRADSIRFDMNTISYTDLYAYSRYTTRGFPTVPSRILILLAKAGSHLYSVLLVFS